ncbi:TetR/AcrR family transcriptional regulator [Paeniglutamicibacter cryotolerans]|uniref:AcrR family transcriptional regulator n=1 Tax=Paeniglutamicibacter cryotolerans TaxID=670079 RepID=A0A839QK98_9MICC|nr:TetR/AcrR family transcriptional regulator [Paeniglutamicibacter cryotolerans]MBB2994456.1 AcrR family transcriptional regulator [Paeniglutamicibacter cryotolerans]
MPKIVDHDRRRVELVEATWRIIARLGLDAATMREVAAEAGFANGALKPYFPTKDDLLQATFNYVFSRTNGRAEVAVRGLSGIEGLRAFCREILPLDEERLAEARVVIPFWQAAMHDPAKAAYNVAAMAQWRDELRDRLVESGVRGEGQCDAGAESLLTFMIGAQVVAVVDGGANSAASLLLQLDSILSGLLPTG